MSNVRIVTRSYEDVDLYSAMVQDVEYMLAHNGKRLPPSLSKIMSAQKRLNDNMRYIMVEFIQKNFAITLPDGSPTGISPKTASNAALVHLTETDAALTTNTLDLQFLSNVTLSGAVEANVSAVDGKTTVLADCSLQTEPSTVTVPGFTIPEVQHIELDENNAIVAVTTTPAQEIQDFSFQQAVPSLAKTTVDLPGAAVLTVSVQEDGVGLFEYSQSVGIGQAVIPFAYALPERSIGAHVYGLKCRLTGGQGSVPMNGGRLQVWADAVTSKQDQAEE